MTPTKHMQKKKDTVTFTETFRWFKDTIKEVKTHKMGGSICKSFIR